jgi:mono/diheme cytochrome c family protein
MGYFRSGMLVLSVCAFIGATAYAEEKDITVPRVPGDQRAAAKAMKNPVAKTPENIAKGKAIFEGKGTCFNCHGLSGKGDGPAGAILNPTPRNFTNPKFHKLRTDGEMFWVIKNGSAGTGMVPLIGTAITEEEAWYAITYERTFDGKH